MNEAFGNIGPFELREELGRGSMARVWRAWDPVLGREVAIKEPLFDSRYSEGKRARMSRRFVREARTAAKLNHPGIVTIYSADVYENNRPAIVMELVEGATLGAILRQNISLDAASTLDALDQLLDAVGYAHQQGVVHRDIKPENIFVRNDGVVKLADFGIAYTDDDSSTRFTEVGTVLGTPAYMSPEQASGQEADNRSDLFSIGVIAYEMLSGRNPFCPNDFCDSTEVLYSIVHSPAEELPAQLSEGVPADMRPAIMAALSKNPYERPQSAAEFKALLHGSGLADTESNSYPQSYNATDTIDIPSGKRASGYRWLPAAVAGVCAVALAVGFFIASSSGGGGGSGNLSTIKNGIVAAASTTSITSAASSSSSTTSAAGSSAGNATASSAAQTNAATTASESTTSSSTTQNNTSSSNGTPTSNDNDSQGNNGGTNLTPELDTQSDKTIVTSSTSSTVTSTKTPKTTSSSTPTKKTTSTSSTTTLKVESSTGGFVGRWDLTGIEESGKTVDADSLATYKSLGYEAYVIFADDGTVTLKTFENTANGTWEETDKTSGKMKLEKNDITFRLVEGKLKLEQDKTSLIFTKSAGAKTASTTSNQSSSVASSESTSTSTSAGTN